MMAGCGVAAVGALLLVMLTGASYSYPVKKGSHPGSSYGSGYGANPASGGSSWDVPSSGGFAPVASGSGAASGTVSAATAPRRELSYSQPAPATASYSSSSFAAPVYSGYVGSSSAGPVHPSFLQPVSDQDIHWAHPPPSPLSAEEPSASSVSEPLGPSNVSPPGPFQPEFQTGELSHYEAIYEHGNSESETEDEGFQQPPPGEVFNAQESPEELQPLGLGRPWVPYFYPYPYDYMFLTGQYPPGTVTHASSSYEQGRDHWQDAHYIREYLPASPSTQQVQTFTADFQAPQKIEQPSQPVKQSTGSTSYGPSDVYGADGVQGASEQPRPHNPARGYSMTKVG